MYIFLYFLFLVLPFIFSHKYFSAFLYTFLYISYFYIFFLCFICFFVIVSIAMLLYSFLYMYLLSLHTLLHFSHLHFSICIFVYLDIFIFSYFHNRIFGRFHRCRTGQSEVNFLLKYVSNIEEHYLIVLF